MMNLIPRPIPPEAYQSSRLRIVLVDSDNMEPTLRKGDCVMVLPVTQFEYDTIYAIDRGDGLVIVIRAYQARYGMIRLQRDNELYPRSDRDDLVDLDWFNEHVVGLVVADIKLRDPVALSRLSV